MKYFFLLLIAIALFTCEKKNVDKKELAGQDTFFIGYTGGWGGGPAYKLEDGQLFRSVEDNFLGEPADIINAVTYAPVTDTEKLQMVSSLADDFPASNFAGISSKFDCPEQAYDGTCPYLIQVKSNNDFSFWTLSELDEEAAPDFTDYLGRVSNVLNLLWE